MKKWKNLLLCLLLIPCFVLASCGSWSNPGDYLGGGGSSSGEAPTASTDTVVTQVSSVTSSFSSLSANTETAVPSGATDITTLDSHTITSSGNYYLSGTLALTGSDQIKVSSSLTDVVIYLDSATITKEGKKKAINLQSSATIVLIGSNTISSEVSSAVIGSDADVTITGSGSLSITSTDNAIEASGTAYLVGASLTVNSSNHGIKASAVVVVNSTAQIDACKDGIHAEIEDYDTLTTAPTFSYDNGFAYIYNSSVTIETTYTTTNGEVDAGDGIQADTFVQVVGGSLNITTYGGTPSTVTESSADKADGKAIKAGTIDWGTADSELEVNDYAIILQGGTYVINSNDDALHSNGYLVIDGGTYSITSGDDAIHADYLLKVYETGNETSIIITLCYEGVEAQKIEIYGGTIDLYAVDDGINAANSNDKDLTTSDFYIIVYGGSVTVNADGDGLDSNGTILIEGGEVYVHGPTSDNDAALDAEVKSGIYVNGGTLVAVGSLGMVETPNTNSTQYVVSFASKNTISAGTTLYLTDTAGGTVYLSFTTKKECASVILSSASLTAGTTYAIYGGSTKLATFTISSIITTVGTTSTSQQPSGIPSGYQGGGIH